METLDAIHGRRSIGKVKAERPPREAIERMLEAAVQAPNHHLTQPWRFFVLAGKARDQLGQAMAEVIRDRVDDPEGEPGRTQIAKEAEKPLRAPVIIVVGTRISDNPKVVPVEEIEATAAAVQNMLLVAHDQGLAAMWRTGDAAYESGVKQIFGLGPKDHLAGFIYVGYPDMAPPTRPRGPVGDKAEWRGWD